jgi:spore germination protein GerM
VAEPRNERPAAGVPSAEMPTRSAALGMLVAALTAVTVACGAGEEPTAQATPQAATARTTLYFLTDDGRAPIGVRRTITKDVPPLQGATTRGALKALLAGPSPDEQAAGITTAIPEGAELLSLTYRGYGGTGAVVDISGLAAVGELLDRPRVITQVVRTLIWSGQLERVWFRSEGRPWGLAMMDGGVRDGPFDYDTLYGFWLGEGCPGTETVECDSFRALP